MGQNADLIFVIGLVIGVLMLPALLSAYSEGRSPRSAAILGMISIGLIAVAVMQRPPGTYSATTAPDVFASVVRDVFL